MRIIRLIVITTARLLLRARIFRDVYEHWAESIKPAHHQEIESMNSAPSLNYPPELELIQAKLGNKISIVFAKKNDLLSELFDRYGSDKGYIQVDNHPYTWRPHSYSDYYSLMFENRRESIKKVFECGIGTNDVSVLSNMTSNGKPGASLRAWRDFFPHAFVYGADIDRNILFEEERIKTFYVDQMNPQSIHHCWNEVGEKDFDIILDDGLHTFEAGITLFVNSIERLGATGCYIIEDVSLNNLLRYEAYFQTTDYSVQYVSLNDRNRNQLGDNSLVIVKKHQK